MNLGRLLPLSLSLFALFAACKSAPLGYEPKPEDPLDGYKGTLREAGANLYNWAEFETGKIESLRIRARVTEPYVLRGSFHILADSTPKPKVYWHPRFLDRIGKVLGVAP